MKFLIINGPNINMLGIREPEIYGAQSYAALTELCRKTCEAEGIEVKLFQSNHEGAIVDEIQAAYGVFDGIIINPAASPGSGREPLRIMAARPLAFSDRKA